MFIERPYFIRLFIYKEGVFKFRKWAAARIKEYIIKGYTVDDEHLKNLGGESFLYTFKLH